MAFVMSIPEKGKETLVETGMGMFCVAANLAMPCVISGVYARSAAWGVFCATILMGLVLVNLWLVYKSKGKLEKKGLRHSRSIRVIAVLLVIGSAFNACVFAPLVARHLAETKAWSHRNSQRTAFEMATLQVNEAGLENNLYPTNLKALLYKDIPGSKLEWGFPDATPEVVKELELLAVALKTREPTETEADLIELAARVKYVGKGLEEKDQKEDFLVLIGTVDVEGKIQLGYSSGRVDRVVPGTVGGIMVKENAKRAQRGLPAIMWP